MNATATTATSAQYDLNIGPAAGCHMYGSMSLEAAREAVAKHAAQFNMDLEIGEFEMKGPGPIATIKRTTRPNPKQNDKGGQVINWGILVKLS